LVQVHSFTTSGSGAHGMTATALCILRVGRAGRSSSCGELRDTAKSVRVRRHRPRQADLSVQIC
jgi:hypothetical protein